RMKITPELFAAFLKCQTKCWLRANSEPPNGNCYAEWVKTANESYRVTETERFVGESSNGEVAASTASENLKAAKWRIATSYIIRAQTNPSALEADIHAVERASAGGSRKATQFIPI